MIGKCILLLPISYYLFPYLFWKTVPPDKIRYIRLIRVRFTTESFFFEHGFIGLTRMLRSVGGTVFQTKLGNG